VVNNPLMPSLYVGPREEVVSRVGEEALVQLQPSPHLREVAYAYAVPENQSFPLDLEGLRGFLTTPVIPADDALYGQTLTARDFLLAIKAATSTASSPNGFHFPELQLLIEVEPYSHARRNVPQALETCINLGVVVQDLSEYPAPPRYYLAKDSRILEELERSDQPLSEQAYKFASQKLSDTTAGNFSGLKFAEISVAEYLLQRAAGKTITAIIKEGTIAQQTAESFTNPAPILETIEEEAIQLGLVSRSNTDPRILCAHSQLTQLSSSCTE
jgi:hypothetical protein